MAERQKGTPEKSEERNYTRDGNATWKQLREVGRFGYSHSMVFTDFVDTALLALLSLTDNLRHPDIIERLRQNKFTGTYEEQYMRIVGKYRENKDRPRGQRPADYFAQAWAVLQQETGFVGQDVLGEIYMREITHGEHGQFFTPTPVSDFMAEITGGSEGETVCDPCCGSGRFFISIAKMNPNLRFVGVDISDVCAKMTVLNMWMFNLNADIYCGNSLSMEMFQVWNVRKGGFVYESKVE
jgi:type I restriction-modification system DNA methylase subunit